MGATDAPARAGMPTSMLSRSIGRLERKKIRIHMKKSCEIQAKIKAYPADFGALVGNRKRRGAMSRGASLEMEPPPVLPRGAEPVGLRVVVSLDDWPLEAIGATLEVLGAAVEEPDARGRLAGTLGGRVRGAASESPMFEPLPSSSHSAKNRSREESGVPPRAVVRVSAAAASSSSSYSSGKSENPSEDASSSVESEGEPRRCTPHPRGHPL